MRIDPPPSEEVTRGSTPPASAAEEPPLDPPGVRSRFQGERVTPNSGFLVIAVKPNSGVFVLPTTIAPAARSRATWVESASATESRNTREPMEVTMPATSSRSLTPRGTPSSGRASPAARRASAVSASVISASRDRWLTTALSLGCVASMPSRVAVINSTQEASRADRTSRSSIRLRRSNCMRILRVRNRCWEVVCRRWVGGVLQANATGPRSEVAQAASGLVAGRHAGSASRNSTQRWISVSRQFASNRPATFRASRAKRTPR